MEDLFEKLIRFDKDQKYIVFDLETEGLSLINSRPWQASWVVCQGNKILEEHDYYIKWDDLDISEDAQKITKFDRVHYKKHCKDPVDIYDKLETYLKDDSYLIVGQNILGYDVYITNVWQDNINRPRFFPVERTLDTKAFATAIAKGFDYDCSEDFTAWQYKATSIFERGLRTSQAFLLKNYDIPHDKSKLHNSLYDVKMTFEIFKKQMFKISIPSFKN